MIINKTETGYRLEHRGMEVEFLRSRRVVESFACMALDQLIANREREMNTTVGTCSICGGRVTVPHIWGGVTPPTPTCDRCGATAASHGPVIPMRSRESTKITSDGWSDLLMATKANSESKP